MACLGGAAGSAFDAAGGDLFEFVAAVCSDACGAAMPVGLAMQIQVQEVQALRVGYTHDACSYNPTEPIDERRCCMMADVCVSDRATPFQFGRLNKAFL